MMFQSLELTNLITVYIKVKMLKQKKRILENKKIKTNNTKLRNHSEYSSLALIERKRQATNFSAK